MLCFGWWLEQTNYFVKNYYYPVILLPIVMIDCRSTYHDALLASIIYDSPQSIMICCSEISFAEIFRYLLQFCSKIYFWISYALETPISRQWSRWIWMPAVIRIYYYYYLACNFSPATMPVARRNAQPSHVRRPIIGCSTVYTSSFSKKEKKPSSFHHQALFRRK